MRCSAADKIRNWRGAVAKLKKSLKSANVFLFFSYDENDVELGASAEEKGKIDSKVGTTNSDNDFVKFKVHEYNQSPWESFLCRYNYLANDSSFLRFKMTIYSTFEIIIANATIFNECKILFVPIFDQSRIHFTLCAINLETRNILLRLLYEYFELRLWCMSRNIRTRNRRSFNANSQKWSRNCQIKLWR